MELQQAVTYLAAVAVPMWLVIEHLLMRSRSVDRS